jgi:diaminopimelate epimerase
VSSGTQRVTVIKMNGTKNDFVVLDDRAQRVGSYAELARRWCDRATGVGADGLLVVLPGRVGSVAAMRVYNADGGEAEMCGNGIRCVARYLWEEGAGDRFTIDTVAGPIGLEVADDEAVVVRVDVGVPRLIQRYADGATVEAAGRVWRYGHVDLGNPHVVLFVDDPSDIDLERIGAALATHPQFEQGTNVHVARASGPHELVVRHYERGVGITQACGTGAVAVAAVAIADGRVASPVAVHVPGGTLGVAWEPGGRAILSGPAEVEFERSLEIV